MSLLETLQKESEQVLDEKVTAKEPILEFDTFDENAIPGIVDSIFESALNKHASDVHFKPKEDKYEVYFRVDGSMIQHKILDSIYIHPIVAHIKILSGMKTDEHRIPQDGKSTFKSKDGKEVDLRVSVMPTQYGEKVVIRILEKNPKMIALRDLGMLPNIFLKIERYLKATYGMILAVGPTGSGKSTSLFSMVSMFNAKEFNISTLEDPIEYKINDVTQTQIKPDIGFDFENGLRAIVRQDPDIIMVGEVRDIETASLAIEAALTGHLVFSTLHANSAVATIQRLLDLGVDKFLITAAIKLIISQRLVKKICSHCREKYPVPEKYYDLFEQNTDIDPRNAYLYKANGCKECENTGRSGRVGLFEVLEMSPEIEELIIKNVSNKQIEEQAVKEGMVLIKKDALYKAVIGDITIDEALKAMA